MNDKEAIEDLCDLIGRGEELQKIKELLMKECQEVGV